MHYARRNAILLVFSTLIACTADEEASDAPIPISRFGTAPLESGQGQGAERGASEIPSAVFGDPSRDPDAIAAARRGGAEGSDVTTGPPPPCSLGDYEPCVCDNGADGLIPCEDPAGVCDCAGCPGAQPSQPAGLLITSAGQFFFSVGSIALTHREGDPQGGAGCIISAALSFAASDTEGQACRVQIEASGELVDGALPLSSLSFEADDGCLGMSPQDQGLYTTSVFNEGALSLSPKSVASPASLSCWEGNAALSVEAILTREDGQTLTLSTSELTMSGSGLSMGKDQACPSEAESVDINACEKVVPLSEACNPYCQLGCALGEHCVVDGSAFVCAQIGSLPPGASCTTPDSCSYANSCFSLGSEPSAQCHTPCINDDDCAPSGLCNTVASIGGGLSLSICSEPTQACNVLGSEGCGEGQGCYLNGNSSQCLPGGNLGLGEVCEGGPANSCAPGLQCFVTCRELCSTASQQPSCASCPAGSHEFSPSLSLGFCLEGGPPTLCDLFSQTGCEAGQGCYPVVGGIACRTAGTRAPGVDCQSGNSCLPGHACVNAKCLELCDLNAALSDPTSCDARCPTSMGAILPVSWQIGVCLEL